MVNPGTPPPPHVGGPITTGAPTVLIGGPPAARVTDMATCAGPPDTIVMGSPTVIICGQMAARIGDNTAHGGVIVAGCPTVLIGGAGAGGGGGVGGGAADAAAATAAPPSSSAPPVSGEISSSAKGLLSRLSSFAKDIFHRVLGEKYNKGITIRGPKEYRDKVRARLDELNKTSSGQAIIKRLEELGKQGKRTTIVFAAPGDNHCTPLGNFGRWKNAYPKKGAVDLSTGKVVVSEAGKGTSSEVGFNPDYEPLYADATSCRSPAIGLGHELLHAVHNGEGRNLMNYQDTTDAGTWPNPSDHEEAQTIGRGAYANGKPTDNSLRDEMGYKRRTSHASVCP
jgi:uncharacterized Zn-binding protein involved in type VI secretion